MNVSLIPSKDVLNQLGDVERALRARNRLAAGAKSALLVLAAVELILLAVNDGKLKPIMWLPVGIGVLGVLALIWTRFWLRESKGAFRYTFALDPLEPVTESDGDTPSWLGPWLRVDVAQRLSARIGRLLLLDPAQVPDSGKDGLGLSSHITVGAVFGIRPVESPADGKRTIEVTPRVRIGDLAAPFSLAEPVPVDVDPKDLVDHEPQSSAAVALEAISAEREEPVRGLGPDWYEDLVERVYFSVASHIYRQLRVDVEHKIHLLPTHGLRATAYLREADDYARSRTLDAYEDAKVLYRKARDEYKRPRWRRLLAGRWGRGAIKRAEAETGLASMLLYRRVLTALSGRQIDAWFAARHHAEQAISRLERMRFRSGERKEALFDAYVARALAESYRWERRSARATLDKARRLLPARAESDATFLHAFGAAAPDRMTRMRSYRRSLERDAVFEVAGFDFAYEQEMLWRGRPTLEASVAPLVVREYELLVRRNPGLVGAWANIGYIRWLLADSGPELDKARMAEASEAFTTGRRYKQIKHETFVGELDYGLARIAVEQGRIEDAYRHYVDAFSALVAEDLPALSDYYFAHIGEAVLERFRRYKERALTALRADGCQERKRIVRSVTAFVLNDYGEALVAYTRRHGLVEDGIEAEAEACFRDAKELNPDFVMPAFNLGRMRAGKDDSQGAITYFEAVVDREPTWSPAVRELAEANIDRARKQPAELRALSDQLTDVETHLADARTTHAKAVERQTRSGPVMPGDETDLRRLEDDISALEGRRTALVEQCEELPAVGTFLELSESLTRRLLERKWAITEAPSEHDRITAIARWLVERDDDWLEQVSDPDLDSLVSYTRVLSIQQTPETLLWAIRTCNLLMGRCGAGYYRLVETLGIALANLEEPPVRARQWRRQLRTAPLHGRDAKAAAEWQQGQQLATLLDIIREDWSQAQWIPRLMPNPPPEVWAAADDNLRSWADVGNVALMTREFPRSMVPEVAADLLERGSDREDEKLLAELDGTVKRTASAALSLFLADQYAHGVRADESIKLYGAAIDGFKETDRRRAEAATRRAGVVWERDGIDAALESLADCVVTLEQHEELEGAIQRLAEHVDGLHEYRRFRQWVISILGQVQAGPERVTRVLVGLSQQRWLPVLGGALPIGRDSDHVITVTTPLAIEAHGDVFPQAEGWSTGHTLFDVSLPAMRQRVTAETGVTIPGVRVRASTTLGANGYQVLIHDAVVASGTLDVVTPELGELVDRLEPVVREHLAWLVDADSVAAMLGEGERGPAVLAQWNGDGRLVRFAAVLRSLVRERLVIADIADAARAFAACAERTQDLGEICEAVRSGLLERAPLTPPGRLVIVPRADEATIRQNLTEVAGRRLLSLTAGDRKELMSHLAEAAGGGDGLLVRDPALRRFVRYLTAERWPDLPVIASTDLDPATPWFTPEHVHVG